MNLKYRIFRAWMYVLNRHAMHVPSHVFRRGMLRLAGVRMGKGCGFLMGCEVRGPERILVGNNCVVNRGVLLDGRGGKLTIGDNVDIAQEAVIWTLGHDVHDDYHRDKGGPVTIEDYAWIGHRAIIMPGVTIGRGAVVDEAYELFLDLDATEEQIDFPIVYTSAKAGPAARSWPPAPW